MKPFTGISDLLYALFISNNQDILHWGFCIKMTMNKRSTTHGLKKVELHKMKAIKVIVVMSK